MNKFVHLHTHTHYSLLDGMSKIDELVAKAKEFKMDALAITDHGNLYGAIEFYKACKEAGIKPILGVEAYIAPGDCRDKSTGRDEKGYYHLVLLAKNESGWKNLLKLVTLSHLEGYYYKPRMDKEMLRKHSEGLIALSGCLGGELSQLLLQNRKEEAKKIAQEYEAIFGKDNYYIELGRHPEISEAEKVTPLLIQLAKETGIPLVATKDSHYLNDEDRPVHDILLAIQTGQNMDMDKEKRFTLEGYFSFAPEESMLETFQDLPEALENTVKIAQACNVELPLGKILLPKFHAPEGKDSAAYLREIVKEKTAQRYPNPDEKIHQRIEHELSIIETMGFPDYFLIVADFINWAKDRGIRVGPGRGSAAGSIVSYITGITDIDPIKYDLLFERFLNPARIQMPDIDIDLSDSRRDEVLAYLQEKYGEDHFAHIITFGTMAARAAIRDVGRALNIEYSFCDYLAKLIPFGKNLSQALRIVSELDDLYKKDERAKKIIDAAKRLEGVARHASVHACGTVISDKPLTDYVPLQYSPQKNNVIVTQFEMHAIEDLGLLKMDLLGLKNLTIIENTLELIRDLYGKNLDTNTFPLDDKKSFSLLQDTNTTGVFQLESGGMRRYLKELKPSEFEDIIAMVSLYRPGPMDLIPSYIARKHGKEQVSYLHPKLKPILEKTYGIGVYQEQMMKIASDLAGYSLAEADILRKAIGKKIKKLLDEQQDKLVSGMVKNGIEKRTAQAIWELFPPFAKYGFNRSHGASYAMIAYQTAYLKAHYPIAFMTALLNADAGDTDRIAFLIEEAKHMGIEVLPPDINKSSAAFTPDFEGQANELKGNIRFGLNAIKNVGHNIVSAIVSERISSGEFKDFISVISRVTHKDLNKKSLESMIKAGVFDSLGTGRNTLLENMDEILKFSQRMKKTDNGSQAGLFGSNYAPAPSSLKLKEAQPLDPGQKLAWEKELLGLYVSDHPLKTSKEKLDTVNPTAIKVIKEDRSGSKSYRVAGLVVRVKTIITKSNKAMAFIRLEDLTDSIELVVFPDLYEKTKAVWAEGKLIALVGKLSFRNGELSMIVDNAKEL
ncbi:MAG: DNA polymerase III subunit alpha [Candidatus Harrisonbacteria bacterium]|nr:DNA polymerase III subunit alpha [Candidatus Harrisonbacteria bacterium]